MIRVLLENVEGWIQDNEAKQTYTFVSAERKKDAKELAFELPSWLFELQFKHSYYVVRFAPFNKTWRKQVWKRIRDWRLD